MIDALQSTHAELSAALAESRARMMSQALEIYYAAEELARDPAHAHVAKHVQEMREAYERQFGMPVPALPR